MFYDENRRVPFSRSELLKRKITGFYFAEEKFLSKVKNRNIVNTDRLPAPMEIQEMYQRSGIQEEKARFIAANYETKIQMVQDLQKGFTILQFAPGGGH